MIDGQGKRIGQAAYVEPVVEKYEGYDELLLAEGEKIELKYELADSLHAPVKEGDYIGKISYMLGDEVLKECKVYVKNSVEQIDFAWCFEKVMEFVCFP